TEEMAAAFKFACPEARGACLPRHAKTDHPQSIVFISQQEAKTHSCYPVFPCLSCPFCGGRASEEGPAWMALIHE
ncbi:hypothetical protein XENOCAPTIV_017805, partial [Xenoophorus captivus]